MSNPPFGSPLYKEEDDFSFPFEPPNDEHEPINFPPQIEDHNTFNFPSTSSSSLPMSEYQDLSIFLGDDDHEQDYTLIGHFDTNIQHDDTIINWDSPIEQVVVGLDNHDHVQLGGVQYYQPSATMTTTAIDDQAAVGGGGGGSGGGGGGEGSSSKKLDHNAKEKVRRMKLNETYLTLGSLLPESKKAKKKKSAPHIIDRALDYIPHLQAEVERLTLEKTKIQTMLQKKQQLVSLGTSTSSSSSSIRDDHNNNFINKDNNNTLTVSINEVKKGEVIIQLCEHNNKAAGILSTLIEKLQGEQGLHILGASSLRACEDRSCFHLHVKMGENPVEADYVAILHKKIISWMSS